MTSVQSISTLIFIMRAVTCLSWRVPASSCCSLHWFFGNIAAFLVLYTVGVTHSPRSKSQPETCSRQQHDEPLDGLSKLMHHDGGSTVRQGGHYVVGVCYVPWLVCSCCYGGHREVHKACRECAIGYHGVLLRAL